MQIAALLSVFIFSTPFFLAVPPPSAAAARHPEDPAAGHQFRDPAAGHQFRDPAAGHQFRDPAASQQAEDAGEMQRQASVEVLVEVRMHGNYSIPDEEILHLAGIAIGDPISDARIDEIRERLRTSGRFEWVEIRKRYRSMSRSDQVVLVVSVRERVSVKDKFLFLPIFTWTDEYGVTYGARFTFIDLLGADERISFPLTWGGDKRAAVETRFALEEEAKSAITSGASISRRENPHFEVDDDRIEVWGGVYRRLGHVQATLDFGFTNVSFDDIEDEFFTYGVSLKLDTRQEINLPRDDVYVGFGWNQLNILDGDTINRYTVDLRGFKGFIGRSILAAQFLYRGADGRLPDYERPFMGGAATLRGYEAGQFIGDNLAIGSVELRWPIHAPVPLAQVGLHFFFDTGAVYDHGVSLRDVKFRHGIGGGAYLFAAFFGLKVDVGYGLDEFEEDRWHFHFSTGFRF